MDMRAAAVTVNPVEPLTVPKVPRMVAEPGAIPVLSPVALMVATAGFDDTHVTVVVMFFVLPSLYFPVATNCNVVPAAIERFAGVTAIERRVGDRLVLASKAPPSITSNRQALNLTKRELTNKENCTWNPYSVREHLSLYQTESRLCSRTGLVLFLG